MRCCGSIGQGEGRGSLRACENVGNGIELEDVDVAGVDVEMGARRSCRKEVYEGRSNVNAAPCMISTS